MRLHHLKKVIFSLALFFLALILFKASFLSFQKQKIPTEVGKIIENSKFILDRKKISTVEVLKINRNNFEKEKKITSEIKTPLFNFTGLIIEWKENIPPKTHLSFQIRILENNRWTDFFPVPLDEDGKYEVNDQSKRSFISFNDATAFQYQIHLSSENPNLSPEISDLTFIYLRSEKEPQKSYLSHISNLISSLQFISTDRLKIISREEWGADESFRIYNGHDKPLDLMLEDEKDFREEYKDEIKIEKIVEKNGNGDLLVWPLEYPKEIKKIIVHHTASTKNLDDNAQAVRNIYHYHAVGRGYGDIGYNFLIDPSGNIYEGRAGGETVVAAHAKKFNHGSIGIAILGDYNTKQASFEATQSLLDLITYLSKKYKVKPNKSSLFRGELIPNILGHREVGQTTCPGQKIFEKIPALRSFVSLQQDLTKEDSHNAADTLPYDFQEISSRNIQKIKADQNQKITISIKNIGIKSWNKNTFMLSEKNPFNQGHITFNKNPKNEINIANLNEPSVDPGQIGTFEINMRSGLKEGLLNFHLVPIFDGLKKANKDLLLPIFIQEPILSYEFVRSDMPTKILKKGKKVSFFIELKNTGDTKWQKSGDTPIKIGTDNPKDHPSIFSSKKSNRLGMLVQEIVEPGEIGRFDFNLKTPEIGGFYEESITPLIESIGWMENQGLKIKLNVKGSKLSAEFIDKSPEPIFSPQEQKEVWIKIKNTGDIIWQDQGPNSLKLKINKTKDIALTNITIPKEIHPAETGIITFKITAPSKISKYKIFLYPEINGKRLMKKPLYFTFEVKNTPQISNSPQNKGGDIRIKLTFKGNPIIKANGNYTVVVDGKEIKKNTKDEEIEVTYKEDKYILKTLSHALTFNSYPRFIPGAGAILEIKNLEKRPAWNKNINDNRFRGLIEVRYLDGELTLINELPLEDYLKGLGEVPNGDPFEKHKAIVVAARSYAKYYQETNQKFPGKPYHGSDDPDIYQKYLGYNLETRAPNLVKAVEDTWGEVVTYQGKLVKTPYFSQSDGRTRSAKEIWGTDIPYLQSVDDPYCKGLTLWGHGVGLSGCGADVAARNGKTYQEILKYYYQGIEITKIY